MSLRIKLSQCSLNSKRIYMHKTSTLNQLHRTQSTVNVGTKHEFLTKLYITSESLLSNLTIDKQTNRFKIRDQFEIKIEPKYFSQLKNSKDLDTIYKYLDTHFNELNTKEKSIILKIISICNKNKHSACLTDITRRLEEDLYGRFNECDLVDLNNICEAIRLTGRSINLKQNIIDHAANLITEKINQLDKSLPQTLFNHDSNESNQILNDLNRQWSLEMNYTNDLLFMLSFIKTFNYFTVAYLKSLKTSLTSCEYVNNLANYDIADILAISRNVTLKKSNDLFKQHLIPADRKQLQVFLSHLSGLDVIFEYILKLKTNGYFEMYKPAVLSFLIAKVNNAENMEELRQCHKLFRDFFTEKSGYYPSNLEKSRIFARIMHKKEHVRSALIKLDQRFYAKNEHQRFMDNFNEAKYLFYRKILDVRKLNGNKEHLRDFMHLFDYNNIPSDIHMRLVEIVNSTPILDVHMKNFNMLEFRQTLELIRKTRIFMIRQSDKLLHLIENYHLDKVTLKYAIFILAKNPAYYNKIHSLVMLHLRDKELYHSNKIITTIIVSNKVTKNFNPLLNEIYEHLVQLIHQPITTERSRIILSSFWKCVVNKKLYLNPVAIDLATFKSSIHKEIEELNSVVGDINRIKLRFLKKRLEAMSYVIKINNQYDIELLTEFTSMCLDLLPIIVSSNIFNSFEIFVFFDLFNHFDANHLIELNSESGILFKKNLIALENFHAQHYTGLIKGIIKNQTFFGTLRLIEYCFSLFNLNVINEEALTDLFPKDVCLNDLVNDIVSEFERIRNESKRAKKRIKKSSILVYIQALHLLNMEAYYNGLKSIPLLFEGTTPVKSKNIFEHTYIQHDLNKMYGDHVVVKNPIYACGLTVDFALKILHKAPNSYRLIKLDIPIIVSEEASMNPYDDYRFNFLKKLYPVVILNQDYEVKDQQNYIQQKVKNAILNFNKKNAIVNLSETKI